jgi:hypothetical protein
MHDDRDDGGGGGDDVFFTSTDKSNIGICRGAALVNGITKHKIKEERRKLMSVYCWSQSNCVG